MATCGEGKGVEDRLRSLRAADHAETCADSPATVEIRLGLLGLLPKESATAAWQPDRAAPGAPHFWCVSLRLAGSSTRLQAAAADLAARSGCSVAWRHRSRRREPGTASMARSAVLLQQGSSFSVGVIRSQSRLKSGGPAWAGQQASRVEVARTARREGILPGEGNRGALSHGPGRQAGVTGPPRPPGGAGRWCAAANAA